MHLTDEAIARYQEIYKKEFGEDIRKEEARRQGTKLVTLIKLIYKPIKKSDIEKLNKK